MRGFKNFKGSDASGPSMYSYSMGWWLNVVDATCVIQPDMLYFGTLYPRFKYISGHCTCTYISQTRASALGITIQTCKLTLNVYLIFTVKTETLKAI